MSFGGENSVKILIGFLIGVLFSAPVAADWKKARAAFDQLDFEKALEELLPVAEQGDIRAQLSVGDLYRVNPRIKRDFPKGASWYERAAVQGSAEGQAMLAMVYFHGQGVVQDYKQARHWSEKAAKQNWADGYYILGAIFAKGLGVRPDTLKSMSYYKKATELGNLPSHYYLAAMQAREKDDPDQLVSAMAMALVALLLDDGPKSPELRSMISVEQLTYGRDVVNNPLLFEKTEIAIKSYDLLQELRAIASPEQIAHAKKLSVLLFDRMRQKQKETTDVRIR
jgi:TPR repeat protein